jgi:hypothetical protein
LIRRAAVGSSEMPENLMRCPQEPFPMSEHYMVRLDVTVVVAEQVSIRLRLLACEWNKSKFEYLWVLTT